MLSLLRPIRSLIGLFALAALLTGGDEILRYFVVSPSAVTFLNGAVDGLAVFGLSYYAGFLLRFFGPKVADAPDLVEKVEQAMPRTVIPIQVLIVDSTKLLAYSVNQGPGGMVFICKGLVSELSAEALKGVLAHEIGHCSLRHPLQTGYLLAAVAAYRIMIGIPSLAIPPIILAYQWRSRMQEYQADKAAVSTVGAVAVLAALQEYGAASKDTEEVTGWRLWLSGYPGLESRKAAIRESR